MDALKDTAKEKARKKGHKLLNKLFDSFGGQPEKLDVPSKPPLNLSKSDNPIFYQHSVEDEDLVSRFSNLQLSSQIPASSNSGFVGGFHPGFPAGPAIGAQSAPSLTNGKPGRGEGKISMPTPQTSLTMQMAMMPNESISSATFSRPHSTSGNFSASPVLKPSSSKADTLRPPASPLSPSKGGKKSSDSTSTNISAVSTTSSQAKAGQVQCFGVTKAGKRCGRMVKVKASFVNLIPDGDTSSDDESFPIYCHQHAKELVSSSGFYSHSNREFVEFHDWIPAYLQIETQASLRVEMEKPRSKSDVHGYIYCYEIRDDNTESLKLKVGRAVNLVKRIDQWGKQCGSKEPLLRGYYPPPIEPDEDENIGSMMKGVVQPGDKTPWIHRLERLIHLELADLAANSTHLDKDWPRMAINTDAEGENASTTGRKRSGSKDTSPKKCPDCGSVHREIFEFQRWRQGRNKGKEWESIVKPVIERWGRFVELYV